MPRRNAILATILLILVTATGGAGLAHAASSASGFPESKALGALMARASDALEQSGVDVPEDVAERDVLLLALNVYYEARGEGLSGKAAVAHVTLNRLKDERFPGTLTEVILQPGQFSWTRKPPEIADREALRTSVMVAAKTLAGVLRDRTGGALYFHAARLGEPSWTRGLTRLARIGAHTFYSH